MALRPTFRAPTRVLALAMLLAVADPVSVAWAGPAGPGADAPRRVLVLHSYSRSDVSAFDTQAGLDQALKASGLAVETFVEALDVNRIPPTPQYLEGFAHLLRAKYATFRFEALVASDNDAFNFLRTHRDELFPGVPLVFFGISDYSPAVLDGRSDLTGIGGSRDYHSALAAIERLQPAVSQVAAITDDTTTGRAERAGLEAALRSGHERLNVQFLSLADGNLEQLAGKLARLPSNAAALLLHASVDRDGVAYGVETTTRLLSARSAVPLYVMSDIRIGYGALGGAVTSGHASGEAAGKLVVEILEGTNVGSIPVETIRPARLIFDYKVLRRFGIPTTDLPAGSEVVNRPGSILDQYRGQVIGTALAFTVVSVLLVVLFFEVLRRRRVEARLRSSQTALTGVLNSVPQGIFWKNRDGLYLGCNEVFARAVGRPSAESVKGLTEVEVSRSPDAARMYRADDLEVMSLNRAKRHIVESFEDADGQVRWVETTKLPLADQDGSVYGVLGVWDDITERKVSEQERAKLVEQLQQAVKMEAVGRLAGGMAHDFNNVLTAICGNLELARDELDSPTATAHYLEEVQASADRAASLIRQLLAFSRKQLLAPRIVNLNELVPKLRTMLERLIGEDIVLDTRLDAALGSVKVDPSQVEQVLVNLAVNARDAMPTGGRLLIETRNADLDDTYCASHPDAAPGPHVVLEVSDTGHGMPPEVASRIFEPFFTTKPQGRGTGLGLATAYGSVRQVGGHIEVESQVGVGTRFRVYLPRVAGRPEAVPSRAVSALPASRGETVLLVEDDESVRNLTAAMLTRLGYTVLQAPNGPGALAQAKSPETRIDLLFTDVVMPGMNGRELAEQMAAERPDLRVLFASGYTDNVIVHHGLVDARLSFIAKPFTMQSLASKLREVLDPPAAAM
jgi:two-component system, cell cycle sensor histidine kinase and response regulator CckA